MDEPKVVNQHRSPEEASRKPAAFDRNAHPGAESWFRTRLNFVRNELRKDNPIKLQRDSKYK